MFLRRQEQFESLPTLLLSTSNSPIYHFPRSSTIVTGTSGSGGDDFDAPGLFRHNSVFDTGNMGNSAGLTLHRCNSEIQENDEFEVPIENSFSTKPRHGTQFPSDSNFNCRLNSISPFDTQPSLIEELLKTEGRLKQDYTGFKMIGSGPQGQVISATNSTDGHTYAIKIFDHAEIMAKASSRATHDLEIMASVKDDEHLVRYFSAWAESGALCVVMEKCELSLRGLMSNRRHFNETQLRSLLKDICLGLKNLHALKIAHLNLKPENILRSANNRFKLADISFSAVSRHSAYSAPETGKCHIVDVGLNGDVYSIGAILYELMTGQSILHIDFRQKAIRAKMEQLSSYSWSLRHLVVKMLLIDPTSRPSLSYILDHLPNELELELRWFKEQNQLMAQTIDKLENDLGAKKVKKSGKWNEA